MRLFVWLVLTASALAQPVRPHWSADERQFWYRGGNRQFVRVDLSNPRAQPAFDHARLARVFHCRPDQLPFAGLVFHGRILHLVGEKAWNLNLDSYQLDEVEPELETLPELPQAGPYGTTREATRIVFFNRTAGEVELSWLDEQDLEHKHRRIAPGGSAQQPTYVGQTWLARDFQSQGLLATFQASDCPARAEIDSPVPRSTLESPNRQALLEVRDHNLWLQGGGQLSRDGRADDEYLPENVFWAPDSSRFVALRTRLGKISNFPHPGDRLAEHSVHLFDLQGAQISLSDQLFPHQLALHSLRWKSDSSRFHFVYQERGHQHLRLLESDIQGRVRALAEDSSPTFVCDSEKYYCAWLGDREIVWMSERTGFNHLFRIDAESGQALDLTPGEGVVQQVLALDEERREIYFRLAEPYFARVCKASLDRPGVSVITPALGQHEAIPSPSHRYWVDTWSRSDQPPRVELRTAAGDLLAELERARPLPHPSPSFVTKGRDGVTDIYGRIYLPRPFSKNKQYPVVEHIYAGPHQSFAPKDYATGRESEQALADLGFIVVRIDGMGSNGRSKAFHDVCWKNLRDAGLPDRKLWIRAAARRYPQMDLNRVGIYGSSAGGANAVAALIWHSDFYKVAVADCGNHDLRRDNLFWGEQWMGWPVGPQYAENSNLSHAAELRGKLLILVGGLDDHVDPACSIELAAAVQCPLVVVPQGGRCVIDTPQGQREVRAFLRRELILSGEQRNSAAPRSDRPGSRPGKHP